MKKKKKKKKDEPRSTSEKSEAAKMRVKRVAIFFVPPNLQYRRSQLARESITRSEAKLLLVIVVAEVWFAKLWTHLTFRCSEK